MSAMLDHPRISILRRTQIVSIKRQERGFTAVLEQRPAYIDPRLCTGCGLCLKRCPIMTEGTIRRAFYYGDVPRLAIDPQVCVYFKDGKSTLCRDVCPEGAINFNQSNQEISLKVRGIVAATGFVPYPALEKTRLGYGVVDNVITGLEAESMLRSSGKIVRPSDGRIPERVAIIQCVGSRNRQENNYCSRVCCGYALRLGRTLKYRFGTEVTIFYMDVQSFGHAFDDFLKAAREDLNLVRTMPYDVFPGEDGRVIIPYSLSSVQGPAREEFDLLVLSVGMTPRPEAARTAEILGLELDVHGFFNSEGGSGEPGVVSAGAAAGPRNVAETVAHARSAAEEMIRYLEGYQDGPWQNRRFSMPRRNIPG